VPRPQPVPDPPYAEGTGLPWDVSVTDAVAAIAAARAEHGDTFALHSGDDRYLFTFSPVGVESFYGLPEDKASKGVADYLMLRRKLPDEIFGGRRTLPSTLFRRGDVAGYLSNLDRALDQTIDELGRSGSVDVFVHPDAMAAVAASEKRAERAALDEVADIIADAVHRRDGAGGLFGRIVEEWRSDLEDNRIRGIALDVALIHIASMSNLAAALGWALVDLLEHPEHLTRVISGDADVAQQCALESTRLAQRSIMARAVLSPVTLDTGDVSYQVPPGWTIATLLPLLNTSVAPGLEQWDPDRWTRHRLTDEKSLPSPMLVTAFGHGRHSCPAQAFSLSAMTATMMRLLGSYRMRPQWTTHPRPVPAQIGGVARADGPCRLSYTAVRTGNCR
jgi:cytochrome P450